MKLNVPFFIQKDNTDCGIISLKMAFSFLRKNIPYDLIEKLADKKQNKSLWTINLAIASAKLGFKTKFISKSIHFNPNNLNLDFYKKYSDENFINQSEQLIKKAEHNGVILEEKSVNLAEITKNLSQNSILIVLLNWNIMKEKEAFHGHFVPIVGFDKENIYIHNSSIECPASNLAVKRDLFDRARKSQGTDEDILVISNNI